MSLEVSKGIKVRIITGTPCIFKNCLGVSFFNRLPVPDAKIKALLLCLYPIKSQEPKSLIVFKLANSRQPATGLPCFCNNLYYVGKETEVKRGYHRPWQIHCYIVFPVKYGRGLIDNGVIDLIGETAIGLRKPKDVSRRDSSDIQEHNGMRNIQS